MRVIQWGDKVQVHYVKVFQDGSVVSSHGKAPTELTVGLDHPRLPGLGLELMGLAVGESRTFIVPAQDAYGPFNPRLIRRLARWRFAEHEDLCVGQWVRVWDRQCRRRLVRIVEIGAITVVVDANHRWAGQSLELEVRVIAIRGPEIDSGADSDAGESQARPGVHPERESLALRMPAGNREGEKSCP
jgi:FKBP-type peptidyl-prolyl cis-trans isomerase 2